MTTIEEHGNLLIVKLKTATVTDLSIHPNVIFFVREVYRPVLTVRLPCLVLLYLNIGKKRKKTIIIKTKKVNTRSMESHAKDT